MSIEAEAPHRAPIPGLPLRRVLRFLADAPAKSDTEEFEGTISTDEPIDRRWGIEILVHTAEAVDMARAKNGLPLLLDHDPNKSIGRVVDIRLMDGRLRGKLRFGNGQLATDTLTEVRAGIRIDLSVGYEIIDYRPGEGREMLITRWQPVEVSIVVIPADPSAGIGRSKDRRSMTPEPTRSDLPPPAASTHAPNREEQRRRDEIAALADLAGQRELGVDLILRGESVEGARSKLIAARGSARPIGMQSDPAFLSEVAQRYSLIRAVRALTDPRAAKDAGFEIEASAELSRRTGRDPGKGLMVPIDMPMFGQRTVTFGGTGTNLVQTDVLGDRFIDVLRARMYVVQAGAQMLDGLIGNVAIPRKTAAATAYWIAGDDSDSLTASDPTLNQLTLSPKLLGALTTVSHRMLVQTSYGVEQMLRQDLADTLAAELDRVALEGSGSGAQPRGVLNTSGIGAATFTTGTTPTYAQVLAMETSIDTAGMDRRAYITSPTMRARFKAAEIIASSGRMIWETPEKGLPGEGRMNGYQSWATTNASTQNVLFGNWSDLVIGTWGTLVIDADPGGTNFAKGSVSLRAMMDVDVGVRYAAAFAKLTGV